MVVSSAVPFFPLTAWVFRETWLCFISGEINGRMLKKKINGRRNLSCVLQKGLGFSRVLRNTTEIQFCISIVRVIYVESQIYLDAIMLATGN
jgi:hypothetical protein